MGQQPYGYQQSGYNQNQQPYSYTGRTEYGQQKSDVVVGTGAGKSMASYRLVAGTTNIIITDVDGNEQPPVDGRTITQHQFYEIVNAPLRVRAATAVQTLADTYAENIQPQLPTKADDTNLPKAHAPQSQSTTPPQYPAPATPGTPPGTPKPTTSPNSPPAPSSGSLTSPTSTAGLSSPTTPAAHAGTLAPSGATLPTHGNSPTAGGFTTPGFNPDLGHSTSAAGLGAPLLGAGGLGAGGLGGAGLSTPKGIGGAGGLTAGGPEGGPGAGGALGSALPDAAAMEAAEAANAANGRGGMPMSGAGAGGKGNSKDRTRGVYLPEEEDVWGIRDGVAPPVIGGSW